MKTKVLVADDDPIARALVTVGLGSMQEVDVVEVPDGERALAWLADTSFDAAILDWQMPGKSGIEVVRILREQGSQIPVLMFTAEAEKGRVVEAIVAGVSDYLIKPFDIDALRIKMERLLALARA